MKPVMQTRTGVRGNCLSACFASLLGVSIEKVDFSCGDYTDGNWYDVACEKLRPFGLTLVLVDLRPEITIPAELYVIANGPSPRGHRHAVIYRGDELAHDPHPDGGGILSIEYLSFLLPLHLEVSCVPS